MAGIEWVRDVVDPVRYLGAVAQGKPVEGPLFDVEGEKRRYDANKYLAEKVLTYEGLSGSMDSAGIQGQLMELLRHIDPMQSGGVVESGASPRPRGRRKVVEAVVREV